MGSIGIVVGLILRQFLIDGSDRQATLVERVELITAGAIGALHTAIVFGFFRGQHIQGDAQVLAGLFKLTPKFRAAVHLQGTDGKRRLRLDIKLLYLSVMILMLRLLMSRMIMVVLLCRVQFPKLYWKQQLVKMACPVTG